MGGNGTKIMYALFGHFVGSLYGKLITTEFIISKIEISKFHNFWIWEGGLCALLTLPGGPMCFIDTPGEPDVLY